MQLIIQNQTMDIELEKKPKSKKGKHKEKDAIAITDATPNLKKEENGHAQHVNPMKQEMKMDIAHDTPRLVPFLCTDHDVRGYRLRPITVIMAMDENHAQQILDEALHRNGCLTFNARPYTLKRVDTTTPAAYVELSLGN